MYIEQVGVDDPHEMKEGVIDQWNKLPAQDPKVIEKVRNLQICRLTRF